MNEIKCPNCGKVFQVDEAGYASIVSQVRNALFEKEVEDRINSVRRESAAVQEKALAELNAKHKQALTEKDLEINHLKDNARAAETEKQLAVRTAVQEKENQRPRSFVLKAAPCFLFALPAKRFLLQESAERVNIPV